MCMDAMTEVIDQSGKTANAVATRLAPVMRFLAAGVVNTLLSIAVYQAALFFTGHAVAYGIAYVGGILFAYFAYTRHVFNVAQSTKRFVAFALFYIVGGCVGTLVNAALIEHLGVHARIAIFVTVMVMVPFNYLGSLWCLRGTAGKNQ